MSIFKKEFFLSMLKTVTIHFFLGYSYMTYPNYFWEGCYTISCSCHLYRGFTKYIEIYYIYMKNAPLVPDILDIRLPSGCGQYAFRDIQIMNAQSRFSHIGSE